MRNVNHANKSASRHPGPDARYCRPGQVEPLFGLGRTLIYEYSKRGWVKLIHLRPPGTKRGVTLVDLDSVRELIAKHQSKPVTRIESEVAS